MPAGRPTKYNNSILRKTKEYIRDSDDIEERQLTGLSVKGTELYKSKFKVKIPTLEGLAYHIKVNKDTIQEWKKQHKEFSVLIQELLNKQAQELISKGLSGDYNPTIAKVLLTKHGYREGTDITTDDKALPVPIYGGKSTSDTE